MTTYQPTLSAMTIANLYYGARVVDPGDSRSGVRLVTRSVSERLPDTENAQQMLERVQAERSARLKALAMNEARSNRMLATANAQRAAAMLAKAQSQRCATPATATQEVIVGMAVPFNAVTQAKNGHLMRFRPGAFAVAVANQNIDLIINHVADSPVIASTRERARTLHVWESADALLFRYIPTGVIGQTMLGYVRRGAFVGASIAFRRQTSTSHEANGIVSFTAVDLREISLVPNGVVPRFTQTWVRVMNGSNVYSSGD